MKAIKLLTMFVIAVMLPALAIAQTADEIIEKYIKALGGMEKISAVNSIYMEGVLDVMGNQGNVKTTVLNGKGYKQVIDVMGSQVIMCYTDSMGWQINPMTGNMSAEIMPASQYKSGRDQIFVASAVIDYKSRGYKAEFLGKETVGTVSANKLQLLTPDNNSMVYYFDPETGYLIMTVQQAEMMGQFMQIVMTMSDYQMTNLGYAVPFKVDTNYGGQIALTAKYSKIELNKEIDPAVFAKP